ncbi:response regulator [Candidatus Methylomicrobium oryzae]|jgi:HD-like signal output (HDOD) protein/ActR/RegA family two-component response regulator|uniref:response regulator n=1 Tax=Candidatus Methylomicrobium oryzae TaxID=2802053 RepID=UPI001923FB7C|nr:response regulator [Methylomicrobium sp. RS1]MBL1265241.1 HDOD domain-containing protein [Methylomicrobium sp. RS1]
MNKKNILFVDDDENVISGIQRQLRPYREQWQLFFANNGQQALEWMAKQPIDLIVTDMMMPEMCGDKLLKQVRERYPAAIRIVLSGHADEATLKSGLEVAHQYLSKPCSAEMLREVIAQVFKIQACVSNPRLISGIGDISQLPSLPKIYHELNAAIANENTSNRDIAEIFSRDMVLSAKLLQLVNSPYFGLNRKISSLTEAINLIGLKQLHSLILSVHVKSAFPISNPRLEHHMEYLWLDAMQVSCLARLIALAEQQSDDRPDQAYLSGLLHNLGLLIFMSHSGDKFESLLEHVKNFQTPVAELEAEVFGFNRCEAAAYVLSIWKIPPRIIEAILLQKNPNETDYNGMNALTAVHVAASLSKPPLQDDYARLFEIDLDTEYLQRINKLERLPDWQSLAAKALNQSYQPH